MGVQKCVREHFTADFDLFAVDGQACEEKSIRLFLNIEIVFGNADKSSVSAYENLGIIDDGNALCKGAFQWETIGFTISDDFVCDGVEYNETIF